MQDENILFGIIFFFFFKQEKGNIYSTGISIKVMNNKEKIMRKHWTKLSESLKKR